MIASLKAQNHNPDPPAWAAAAAIAMSPQRRPRLPRKLPSDILTLQSNGHLNLVATPCWQTLLKKSEIVRLRKSRGRLSFFCFCNEHGKGLRM